MKACMSSRHDKKSAKPVAIACYHNTVPNKHGDMVVYWCGDCIRRNNWDVTKEHWEILKEEKKYLPPLEETFGGQVKSGYGHSLDAMPERQSLYLTKTHTVKTHAESAVAKAISKLEADRNKTWYWDPEYTGDGEL